MKKNPTGGRISALILFTTVFCWVVTLCISNNPLVAEHPEYQPAVDTAVAVVHYVFSMMFAAAGSIWLVTLIVAFFFILFRPKKSEEEKAKERLSQVFTGKKEE